MGTVCFAFQPLKFRKERVDGWNRSCESLTIFVTLSLMGMYCLDTQNGLDLASSFSGTFLSFISLPSSNYYPGVGEVGRGLEKKHFSILSIEVSALSHSFLGGLF